MYQFSRALYRELARDVDTSEHPDAHCRVLHACEQNIERLVGDRHYFARPARTLFMDIRRYFPIKGFNPEPCINGLSRERGARD